MEFHASSPPPGNHEGIKRWPESRLGSPDTVARTVSEGALRVRELADVGGWSQDMNVLAGGSGLSDTSPHLPAISRNRCPLSMLGLQLHMSSSKIICIQADRPVGQSHCSSDDTGGDYCIGLSIWESQPSRPAANEERLTGRQPPHLQLHMSSSKSSVSRPTVLWVKAIAAAAAPPTLLELRLDCCDVALR
eukprot:CAMPEP_0204305326 /NCGR_PEP_ID=MMETSP0468-20130131/84868_1 /ASSEMBLY_ACC=CAM_ASM_000383 /TAXON_ID=2969 /ORGANISM="Oxyrrhis marina" /LENGTH=190 /DNA_ID=CAMNT_0051284669 /DNA_START=211 /DNA_END=784 /DNA_ORIENTATION=+